MKEVATITESMRVVADARPASIPPYVFALGLHENHADNFVAVPDRHINA